jgi:hypothetical protein
MVVAFVALCVALAGTASALPGRNRVKRDDIARNAVRTSDIAKNAVRTRHIKARNVTRSKIARRSVNSSLVGTDALTGENILESSLKEVPSAARAANADKVNNLQVQRFAFRAAAGTGATSVLSQNGLSLSASCAAGTALAVTAATTVSGATIHSGGTWVNVAADTPFYFEDDSFNVGDSFDVLDDAVTGSDSIQGSLTYVKADGGVVSATYMAEETGTSACVFAGTAIG